MRSLSKIVRFTESKFNCGISMRVRIYTPTVIPPTEPSVVDPCNPTPCGPNSACRPVGTQPVCTCLSGYQGLPPDCRPECVSSSECPSSQACINQKCRDPCPGTCARDATCRVVNHQPICACPDGWTGDPVTTGCRIIPCKHVSPLLTCPLRFICTLKSRMLCLSCFVVVA